MVGQVNYIAFAQKLVLRHFGQALAVFLVYDPEYVLDWLLFASSDSQPVICAATGLRNVTLPEASVAITASPMLLSVISSHSDSGAVPLPPACAR